MFPVGNVTGKAGFHYSCTAVSSNFILVLDCSSNESFSVRQGLNAVKYETHSVFPCITECPRNRRFRKTFEVQFLPWNSTLRRVDIVSNSDVIIIYLDQRAGSSRITVLCTENTCPYFVIKIDSIRFCDWKYRQRYCRTSDSILRRLDVRRQSKNSNEFLKVFSSWNA
jgi:hypothetical protein